MQDVSQSVLSKFIDSASTTVSELKTKLKPVLNNLFASKILDSITQVDKVLQYYKCRTQINNN